MATYLILNLVVIVLVCLLFRIRVSHIIRPVLLTFAVLVVMTAIFDNVLIVLSIVDYNPSKLIGITIYRAPLEDFMYPLLASLLVPTLWHRLGARHD